MLQANIAKAIVCVEDKQVIIEPGDRIGVDYPCKERLDGASEVKVIKKALKVLKTALRHFSGIYPVESDRGGEGDNGVYTIRVGDTRVLFFVKA